MVLPRALFETNCLLDLALRPTTTRSVSCVQWARDGRIGIGTSDGVCILSLGPISPYDDAVGRRLELKQQWVISSSPVNHFAWSDVGLAKDKRCLLCATFCDGKGGVFGPPDRSSHTEWVCLREFEGVDAVAWHKNRLAIVGDTTINMYSVREGCVSIAAADPLVFTRAPPTSIAWYSSRSLAVGCADGTIILGTERKVVRDPDLRHVQLVRKICASDDDDGEAALVACACTKLELFFVSSSCDVRRCRLERPSGSRPVVCVEGYGLDAMATCSTDGEICAWKLDHANNKATLSFKIASSSETFGIALSPRNLLCACLDRVPADVVKRLEAGSALKVRAVWTDKYFLGDETSAETNDDFLWVGPWAAKKRLQRQVSLDEDRHGSTAANWRLETRSVHLQHLVASQLLLMLDHEDARCANMVEKIREAHFSRAREKATSCPVCLDEKVVFGGHKGRCEKGHVFLLCARELTPIPLDQDRWVCPGCGLSTRADTSQLPALCPLCRVYSSYL